MAEVSDAVKGRIAFISTLSQNRAASLQDTAKLKEGNKAEKGRLLSARQKQLPWLYQWYTQDVQCE